MTVTELIAELQKQPGHLPVQIVYDGSVCTEDIVLVAQWFPNAYMRDGDKGPNCVGLFDSGSADDVRDDPDDLRWPRRLVP